MTRKEKFARSQAAHDRLYRIHLNHWVETGSEASFLKAAYHERIRRQQALEGRILKKRY